MRRAVPIWRRPTAARLAAARRSLSRAGRPTLSYIDAGPADAPGSMILVHGFAGSAITWSPQVRGLSPSWRIVAPDLRGHGRSEAPAGPYDIDVLVEDLRSLLANIDPPHPRLLVGHSWGGCIAAAFAAADAAAGGVDRLALLSTPVSFPMGWAGRLALAMPLWWYRLWWPYRPRWDAAPWALKAMARQGLARWDARLVFPRLQLPCLVLRGAADDDFPGWAFARDVQPVGARQVDLPRARHKMQIQSPHLVNRALDDFLREALSKD